MQYLACEVAAAGSPAAVTCVPVPARVAITRRWKHGHCYQPDPKRALKLVLEVDLIGTTELAALFPESTIWRERAAGLTKSLVAIRA